jgi:hypothetical protein
LCGFMMALVSPASLVPQDAYLNFFCCIRV